MRVSGLVAAEVLAGMREDFDEFARVLDAKITRGQARFRHYDEEEHIWAKERAYVSNNAFKYSKALTGILLQPEDR